MAGSETPHHCKCSDSCTCPSGKCNCKSNKQKENIDEVKMCVGCNNSVKTCTCSTNKSKGAFQEKGKFIFMEFEKVLRYLLWVRLEWETKTSKFIDLGKTDDVESKSQKPETIQQSSSDFGKTNNLGPTGSQERTVTGVRIGDQTQ